MTNLLPSNSSIFSSSLICCLRRGLHLALKFSLASWVFSHAIAALSAPRHSRLAILASRPSSPATSVRSIVSFNSSAGDIAVDRRRVDSPTSLARSPSSARTSLRLPSYPVTKSSRCVLTASSFSAFLRMATESLYNSKVSSMSLDSNTRTSSSVSFTSVRMCSRVRRISSASRAVAST